MTASVINRPFKFGEKDRRLFIVENSEISLKAENDANGNPIFLGRAKVGTLVTEQKWQIRLLTYDINQGITDVEWPENTQGNNSSNYDFVWNDRATYTFG